MEIYKVKDFHKWAKKIGLSDQNLTRAVVEMEQGAYEASLGGEIYKKRIALKGRGKSSSTRTIVAFKSKDRAFFIYGFEKNQRSNISDKEEKALKKLAKSYFQFSRQQLNTAISKSELIKVTQ